MINSSLLFANIPKYIINELQFKNKTLIMDNRIQNVAHFDMSTVSCFMYINMATRMHCEVNSGLVNLAE